MKVRTLTNVKEIEEIIRKCQICHVAMVDQEGKPYIVPMNFGFNEGVIYLHSSRIGKKIGILKSNPEVCIEFSTDYLLRYQNEEVACSWSMKYRSVLAYGKVKFVEEEQQKTEHLDLIMKNYSPKEFKYNPPSIREVSCWKVNVERFEGRIFGY
jgi:nitroimidazol reductase NimA-like FMN-containing flavoprotein (pyridoxamine 5'-phosphate oxidase superfamily)